MLCKPTELFLEGVWCGGHTLGRCQWHTLPPLCCATVCFKILTWGGTIYVHALGHHYSYLQGRTASLIYMWYPNLPCGPCSTTNQIFPVWEATSPTRGVLNYRLYIPHPRIGNGQRVRICVNTNLGGQSTLLFSHLCEPELASKSSQKAARSPFYPGQYLLLYAIFWVWNKEY